MIIYAIQQLPEPYKEVFYLRIFAELNFQQIGKFFGKTSNWACVTFHRARKKIIEEMREEY
jgi:RNA polymerase sigma-70 factor (ECF subfamily)